MKIVPFTIVVALLGNLAVAQQSKSQSMSDIFQLMDGTDAGDTSTKSVGVEDVANQKKSSEENGPVNTTAQPSLERSEILEQATNYVIEEMQRPQRMHFLKIIILPQMLTLMKFMMHGIHKWSCAPLC